MNCVNLNCDLGESFGEYTIGMDEQVIPYITSANVACGFHASDPLIMNQTVELAKINSVEVGAHPGYPDLVGFGRRNMEIPPSHVKRIVQYQLGALDAFCNIHQHKMSHVKPHGAMYNMAAKDRKLAMAICEGIYDYNKELIFLGMYQSEMIKAAKEVGLLSVNEVFADRAYEFDGCLVARSKPGAVIDDDHLIVKRVLKMIKDKTVITIDHKEIPICAESICVHGDHPKAIELVSKLRKELTKEGIALVKLNEVISNRCG